MKQLYFIFVVVLCMATGCGSKKDASGDSDQHIFQIDSVDRVTGVQRMQVSRTNQDIVCNGKKYRLFIDRSPSDSLKKVKSDAGIFTDNRIVLKIARENQADLIVMAHHSADLPNDEADIGSTVEQVVLRSACPVASVTRPEAE